MTRLDDQSTSSPLLQELFALVSDHGVDSMAHAFTMIVNAAMLAERDAALGAGPYERSEQRRGYANGFKSKTVTSRARPSRTGASSSSICLHAPCTACR